MAAYLLGRMAISDPSKYARYKALTPDIIARYGGRFLTRGGEKLTLEGPADERRIVLVEFARGRGGALLSFGRLSAREVAARRRGRHATDDRRRLRAEMTAGANAARTAGDARAGRARRRGDGGGPACARAARRGERARSTNGGDACAK